MTTHPLALAAGALNAHGVRYILIGVYGANMYAPSGQAVFATVDADLLLPPDADNLLAAWRACESSVFPLFSGRQPLEQPRDRWLAERVLDRKALTRSSAGELEINLTLSMAGYTFEAVWAERRVFLIAGVEVPVARLQHIVGSKHLAGRPKMHCFSRPTTMRSNSCSSPISSSDRSFDGGGREAVRPNE